MGKREGEGKHLRRRLEKFLLFLLPGGVMLHFACQLSLPLFLFLSHKLFQLFPSTKSNRAVVLILMRT